MNWFLWILAGIGILFVLLMAFIGIQFLTRGVHVRRLQAPNENTAAPGEAEFPALVSLLTTAEVREGHQVKVMTCGDETYPPLWKDLRSAKRSITAQLYYCQPGRMADEFAAILIERAQAGVRVMFMRDAFGSQKLSQEWLDKLEQAGVTLAAFRPTRWYELHKLQNRSHIRVIVIDGEVGYTGGFGLDDKWYGDGRHENQWRDTSVRFEGPAVLQLQATFAACWCEATGDLITGDLFFPPEGYTPEGEVCAGLLHAAPTVGSTPAERYMAIAIASARKTLYISNSYFVPNDEFCKLLADSAKRGVDVRILTPGPNSDVVSTYYAGRVQVEGLLRAGVRFFEYTPSMMHAKTLIADGVFGSVGSLNFDNRSLSLNDETVLIVHDRAFGAEMERIFADDMPFSEEITLEKHLARPFKHKVLERMYELFYRML